MFFNASRRTTIILQIGLTVLAAIFLMPLLIMFQVSLRGQGFGNYLAVLQQPMIPRFFLNSIIVAVVTVVLVYVITTSAAYAFSKLELRGKGLLFNAVLIGLLLPSVVLLVPLFTTIKTLGLFDNYLALILPLTAFITPFTLLLMRNYLDSLPNELMDAARMDGCTTFTTLIWIIVPLSRPISVVVILWAFLASWNEYFMALVFMRSESMQMITQAPQYFVHTYGVDISKVFAALVLISLPIMLLYLSLQRYFEDGLTGGALK